MSTRANVLVVDDEPLLRDFLEETLRRAGHEVTSASGGTEGLSRVSERTPDLVLLDIRMKGSDGLELLPEFRTRAPHAPVIMMTGHGTVESAVQAMRDVFPAEIRDVEEIKD